MGVNPLEFAVGIIGGVVVGAGIALIACWMLTDNTDSELISALSAAVRRLAGAVNGKDLGKNKERENDEEDEQ